MPAWNCKVIENIRRQKLIGLLKLPSLRKGLIEITNEERNSLRADTQTLQLRDTVRILRSKLEEQSFEKDAAVQQAVQRSADEILQLKNTASSLRDELESLRFEFESKLQKNISEKVDEHSHLKETITILRAQLDERPQE